MKKLIYLLSFICLFLTSCKTKDNLTYFRTNTPTAEQMVTQANWQLKIEPGDELSIYVHTDMEEVTALFNLPDIKEDTKTYLVDKAGNISLPKIGSVHAAGLTTTQLAEEITRKVAEFAEAPR